MKALGVIVNIFFPGIGTMIVGKVGTGIAQLLLYGLGVLLTLTGLLAIIGVPLCIIVWIWAIVTAAQSPDKPIQVTVINQPPR